MTELSPAAQAVLDAANTHATQAWSLATHQRFKSGVAAALRAVADQAPVAVCPCQSWIIAIAAELDKGR